MSDQDTNGPLVEFEPGPDDGPSTSVGDSFGGPALQNEEIGPEDGQFRVQFQVVKLQFQGQRISKVYSRWVVRANSRSEMLDNLWQLARPYVGRAIEFPALNDPCWSEKEVPDKLDAPNYLIIRDNSGKRSFKLDQIDDERWRKWTVQSNLVLIIYIHTHHVHSRPGWELVLDRLFAPRATPKKPALVGEELKLDTMTKRLARIHKDKLVPKSEDAFEQWARWIIRAPHKRHSSLSMSMPPGDLLKNFVPIKPANGQDKSPEWRPPSKRTRRQLISGPAQREHTTDGFGFEDEVKILRQTVTQIRDLVEMLDHRVGLLEEKCQGFKQTVQSGQTEPPKKKAPKQKVQYKDSDSEESAEEDDDEEDDENAGFDDEPLVNEEVGDSDAGEDGRDWVNPDPLLFNDLVQVKEESLDGTE